MKTNTRFKALLFLFLVLGSISAKGQDVAVKTNLLYDIAAFTANAGVEVGLAPRWTLDVSANYNGWTLSGDRRWKHWLVQPEARYWFCDRFAGHFIAGHALGGQYNVGGINPGISFLGTDFRKLADRRYQGWFVGAGLRLRVDPRTPLEPRSRDWSGIHLHAFRQLPVRRMRTETLGGQTAPLCRTHQSGSQSGVYVLTGQKHIAK